MTHHWLTPAVNLQVENSMQLQSCMPEEVTSAFAALAAPSKQKAELEGDSRAPFPLVRYLQETALQDTEFRAHVAARVISLLTFAQKRPDLANVVVLSHTADNAVDFWKGVQGSLPSGADVSRRVLVSIYTCLCITHSCTTLYA